MMEDYQFKVTFKHKHSTPGGMEEEWTIESRGDDENVVGNSVYTINQALLNGPTEEESN